eukprot:maker-scaffold96_size378025-snap-gene-0.19 protein:Tk04954 transcript:maker-scaffold96_size378025-snap-gene-0.19-mRNA-1 annotation:"non-structural maintenance of chromosomes element 4 homolog a-like"
MDPRALQTMDGNVPRVVDTDMELVKGTSSGGDGPEADRPGLRAQYRQLMTSVRQHGEAVLLRDPHNSAPDEQLEAAMERADALFSRVNHAEEALLDAQVCKQFSRLCRQQAEGMSTNVQNFHLQEYADKLIAVLNGQLDDEGHARVPDKNWTRLGKAVQGLFNRAPTLHYLNGALDRGEYQPKPKVLKEKRATMSHQTLIATKATQLTETETSSNLTEVMVQGALQALVHQYKATGKKPVEYFRFVIDPDSFGATVENIFHTSFLVKENRVRFFVNDQTPYIEPVVLVLSMAQWRQIKDALNIQEAMIPRDSSAPSSDAKIRKTDP